MYIKIPIKQSIVKHTIGTSLEVVSFIVFITEIITKYPYTLLYSVV